MSSLISRTFSMGLPFGSSSAHSIVGLKNGPGQIPWSLQPMVTIKSLSIAIFAVISFGLLAEMSMPFSFITSTTTGLTFSAGLFPALESDNLAISIFLGESFSHLTSARVLNTDKQNLFQITYSPMTVRLLGVFQ